MRSFRRVNTRLQPVTKYVAPKDRIRRWKIVRGDKVMIISGKNKGSSGNIAKVMRRTNQVLISGQNLVYKHVPKTSTTETGRVQIEMPVHISRVQILDPSNNRPTKILIKKELDPQTNKLTLMRYAKSSMTPLTKYKSTAYQYEWKDGPFDTMPEAASAVTFKPSLLEPVFPNGVLKELCNVYKKAYYAKKAEKQAAIKAEREVKRRRRQAMSRPPVSKKQKAQNYAARMARADKAAATAPASVE
ncbi:hypothetical protein IWQ60_005751 [Tieghemiomyces parasiticus]|uniref:KOW domain-containing protein n=1 Tax=Tieghemiomyces parasiticus TaxID=78921 RepID=A0A9W8A890_9FUNG|nr:hypothetical protein IWQ60_006366 [Tieghemiomyces parasiticus]KAJ1923641.1 hypothetical protein IWQ60_005751 [Tieghemiomyces parasiticus]